MKCLVTGATGFIGSFLVRKLLADGHQVHAVIRNPRPESTWRIADKLSEIGVLTADLSKSDLHQVFPDLKPDAVFHLAWDGVGSATRDSPQQLVQNVNTTLQMLDFCRLTQCPVFVGLGSQAEYGIATGALSEDSPCTPVTAYGVAKHALSLLVNKFGQVTATRVLWFRLFSAYGPMDDPHHLIPLLVKMLLAGKAPSLTRCEQRWDYLYVTDAVDALVSAATSSATGIFNLGSGNAQPLLETVESARDLVDPTLQIGFGDIPYRPDQVMHLEADITRLREATGWQPRVGLEEGLRATVAWYKENQ
ncbi:NAD(P)-dependent oxidoreductase [Edaphobacter sp. HDX4]|uniref:NAD-dependent epimerase/dehydratase family protein n=1 Tax=Edaphobacter sp. HDX4 TaxID=2794064 RepID=UPI002FE61A7D